MSTQLPRHLLFNAEYVDYGALKYMAGMLARMSDDLMRDIGQADNKAQAMFYGRAIEACNVAEGAIYNVLNIIGNCLDDPAALEALGEAASD